MASAAPAAADARAAAAAPAAAAAVAVAPGIEVRDHPTFGRCAYATRDFAAGEIIVDEEPLVVCAEGGGADAGPAASSTSSSAPALSAWLTRAINENAAAAAVACRAGGAGPEDLRRLCICYLAFCQGNDAARSRVLSEMLNTVGSDAEEAMVVQRARAAAKFIAAALAARGAADGVLRDPPTDVATIERVLLSFELNAHALGGRGALFAVGSKFTHTCGAPNSIFKSAGGRGYHVALRPIAAGDLLTTTYLEGSGPTLMATPYREVFTMEGFGFACRCPRCAAPADDMRALPCPVCAPASARRGGDGLLPKPLALRGARPEGMGVLLYTAAQPSGSSNSSESAPEAAAAAAAAAAPAWVCKGCSVRLPDADALLFGGGERVAEVAAFTASGRAERGAAALVHQTDRDLKEGRVGLGGVGKMLEGVARILGPDHWCTHAMLKGRSELILSELRRAAAAPPGGGSGVTALLEDLQSDWRLRADWVASRSGLDAPFGLFQEICAHAAVLYELYPPLAKSLGPRHPAVSRLLALAAWLRTLAAPAFAVFKDAWPLPEPLGMVASLDAAAAAAVGAGATLDGDGSAAATAGGGGSGEGLSMQGLADFLPTSGGGKKSSGKSSGGAKKKGGGKKK